MDARRVRMVRQGVTRFEDDVNATLFCDVERLRDSQVKRVKPHHPTDDRDVRPVTPIRIGKRSIKGDMGKTWCPTE